MSTNTAPDYRTIPQERMQPVFSLALSMVAIDYSRPGDSVDVNSYIGIVGDRLKSEDERQLFMYVAGKTIGSIEAASFLPTQGTQLLEGVKQMTESKLNRTELTFDDLDAVYELVLEKFKKDETEAVEQE